MELRKRKQIRLPDYDYSQNGAYFITICTIDRQNMFWDVGAIINRPQNEYKLSAYGIIAEESLLEMPKRYLNVNLDKYVVMPNHVHLILLINNDNDGGRFIITPASLPRIIQQYKSAVTKKAGIPIWQKSFYEHIIRSHEDLQEINQYIQMNPEKWLEDKYNRFLIN